MVFDKQLLLLYNRVYTISQRINHDFVYTKMGMTRESDKYGVVIHEIGTITDSMWNNIDDQKITWVDSAVGRYSLSACIQNPNWTWGVSGRVMDAVHAWCVENNCGIRTGFDTFRFRNRKEMTAFLLKWGA